MSSHRVSIAGSLAVTLLAAGCAGGGAGDTDLAGNTFTTTVTADEATAYPGAVGTWTLSFAEDGTFAVQGEGDLSVEGRYSVDGDRVTLVDETGPARCADDPEGTYTFSISGEGATFTAVDDGCLPRRTVLEAGPLTRQGG